MNKPKWSPPPPPKRRPAGVPKETHDEIMRRIRNRWYENHDKCSLRRGGPGLPELAGVLTMVCDLPAPAVHFYARELIKLRPLYKSCAICRGKWSSLIYLVYTTVDITAAKSWLARVRRIQHDLSRRGEERDLVTEILETKITEMK